MPFKKPAEIGRTYKPSWHWTFLLAVAVSILFGLLFFLLALNASKQSPARAIYWFLTAMAFAIAPVVALVGFFILFEKNIKAIKSLASQTDTAVEMLNRQRNLLFQIAQAAKLSDTAREIAYRQDEQNQLRETILESLHKHDFDNTYAMIQNMQTQPRYKELAEELKTLADKYRDGTDQSRIRQIINHIEDLCSRYNWAAANAQVETLIKTFPDSTEAAKMPARIQELKAERKRMLLDQWDKAVKKDDVDSSIKILKEMDQYLTPKEGLALQESASYVYKTKLHNLGVQFSLAVTEKNWETALQTGKEIIRDFPNSRMAKEIRQKMDILKQKKHAKT
jgi:hypothetical protein